MNRVKKVVAIFENLAVFLFCTVVILFLMRYSVLLHSDTFGLNGTCIEGWRPDLG